MEDIERLTIVDLAYRVLQESGQTMTAREIWSQMSAMGRTSSGKTPEATVGAAIYTSIINKDKPLFFKNGASFGLYEWLSNDDKAVFDARRQEMIVKSQSKKTVKSEAIKEHEIDLTKCPSYATVLEAIQATYAEEDAKAFLMQLQSRVDEYLRNTKKYMEATSRVTLEYTKSTIILPFIQLLGYSIFDADEVLPNRVARDNHQIDYTIYGSNGNVRFTVSCLSLKDELDKRHWEELRDTFLGTKNTVAILTNGINYQIYTSGDKSGMLSEQPFASFNVLTDNDLLLYLTYLGKQFYSLKGIAAKSLHAAVVNVLVQNFTNPSDEFISFIVRQLGAKSTKNIREISKSAVRDALITIRNSDTLSEVQ